MTVAGILVTDADSLEAAADILDTRTVGRYAEVDLDAIFGKDDLADYYAMRADELSSEDEDSDPEPEPPAPSAPAIRLVFLCETCEDSGAVTVTNRIRPGLTFRKPCPDCHANAIPTMTYRARTGEATPPIPASPMHCISDDVPAPFDRAEHCRRIASYGGRATLTVHGHHHFRVIGQTGAKVTIERHGLDYWRGVVTGKGWSAPRQLDFLADIRAGRELAAIAA